VVAYTHDLREPDAVNIYIFLGLFVLLALLGGRSKRKDGGGPQKSDEPSGWDDEPWRNAPSLFDDHSDPMGIKPLNQPRHNDD